MDHGRSRLLFGPFKCWKQSYCPLQLLAECTFAARTQNETFLLLQLSKQFVLPLAGLWSGSSDMAGGTHISGPRLRNRPTSVPLSLFFFFSRVLHGAHHRHRFRFRAYASDLHPVPPDRLSPSPAPAGRVCSRPPILTASVAALNAPLASRPLAAWCQSPSPGHSPSPPPAACRTRSLARAPRGTHVTTPPAGHSCASGSAWLGRDSVGGEGASRAGCGMAAQAPHDVRAARH